MSMHRARRSRLDKLIVVRIANDAIRNDFSETAALGRFVFSLTFHAEGARNSSPSFVLTVTE